MVRKITVDDIRRQLRRLPTADITTIIHDCSASQTQFDITDELRYKRLYRIVRVWKIGMKKDLDKFGWEPILIGKELANANR